MQTLAFTGKRSASAVAHALRRTCPVPPMRGSHRPPSPRDAMQETSNFASPDSLSTYLSEINKYPLLTQPQEQELSRRFRKGDLMAGHQLVTANLRFVVKVSYEYRSYGLKMSDLIQEANIGLMKAVQKFDPDKGIRLISYAVWWIRAYIQNYILKSWSLVKLGTTQAQRNLSLDAPMGEDGGNSHVDFVQSASASQDDEFADKEEAGIINARVRTALMRLDPRERFIIEQRVMNERPMTLKELGEHFGFSRERARQLEIRAKDKLKAELAALMAEVDPDAAAMQQ